MTKPIHSFGESGRVLCACSKELVYRPLDGRKWRLACPEWLLGHKEGHCASRPHGSKAECLAEFDIEQEDKPQSAIPREYTHGDI